MLVEKEPVEKTSLAMAAAIANGKLMTIKFADSGQDFLVWIVADGVVVDSHPFQSRVWVGKEVQVQGDTAYLKNGLLGQPVLHKVIEYGETHEAYVAGFNDARCNNKNINRYSTEIQYKRGFNAYMNLVNSAR